jgi:uncharacterized protein with NAD-binding domain and iron-sulfur cluster
MRRVAILGGGMAGLSAAWSLSQPGCRDQFEVTVYQRGWQLGGKGASGRGVNGRIEEHGLHVWLGYYENSFRLLRQVYEELDRPTTDPPCPIASWRDAVAPADHVGVEDRRGGSWAHWVATFSRTRGEPGAHEEPWQPLSVAEFARQGLTLLLDFFASIRPQQARPAPAVVLSGSPRPPAPADGPSLGDFGELLRQAEIMAMIGAVEAIRLLPTVAPRSDSAAGLLLDSLERLRDGIAASLRRDDDARRAGDLADLVVTCLLGTVRDRLLTDPAGFAAIDHLDFREWLAGHGAARETLDSPLVRGLYDLVFAYQDGDPAHPRFAAGLGLFLSGKLFFEYRGAIFWRMQAGMGDVVFAPLYQALRRRGVRFAFFHRVDRLRLTADGASVAAVMLGRQARLAPGHREYEPLVRVKGLPCFPSSPRAEQLTGPVGNGLQSHWSDRGAEDEVRLGAGEDFDDLVLATSLGMVPHLCGELLERSPRWRAMVDGVATVPTQSLQIWLREAEDRLGWPHPGATVSGYVTPFDTYASMSHLLPREQWTGEDSPRAIGYFCSVLANAQAADPATAHAAVRGNAVDFLNRYAGHFWPRAIGPDGRFRWELLCGAAGAKGEARLESQYWRANIDPSDRYVQSLPGSGAHRLRADESGFANLFLAGDWVNCGLNAGCIEAAVMAGAQAANAVRGRPLTEGIVGAWYGLDGT